MSAKQVPTGPDTSADQIDRDDLFDVLSNQRRRYALHYLHQHENGAADRVDHSTDVTTDLSELSTQVTAWEERVPADEITYDDRKSVHTSLAQFHLPKMDRAGIVDYDERRNVVELTDEGADARLYLERVDGGGVPWSVYFLLLSALAGAVGLGATVGTPGLTSVPPSDLLVLVTVSFAVSSAVFVYDSRYRMRLGSDGAPPGRDGSE